MKKLTTALILTAGFALSLFLMGCEDNYQYDDDKPTDTPQVEPNNIPDTGEFNGGY